MAKLLLVRHGLTEFNSNRRFAGFSDIELSPTGRAQAERLRDRLADEKIDMVYSSDLKRAITTAEIVSTGHNVDIVPCPELREVNYGCAEGLTFQEISKNYPDVAEKCINFTIELKFPEGESFKGFIERTCTFLDKVKSLEPSQTMLVVSHSGPLKVLVCRLLGIDVGCWWQIRCDNASLSIIDTYPRGAIVSLLNDVSHLKETPR